MKTLLYAAATAGLCIAAPMALAQDEDKPSKVIVAPSTSGDIDVVAKEVESIIGFGGRISVKDSKAEVLGGAAGDVETENASFETVVLAAGTVTMTGGSVGELKVAAGKVDLNIAVTGDGDVAGGQVNFGERMSVRGDMDLLVGSANIKGSYGGDLVIDGESVTVAGNIGGDLRINARRIAIEPGTVIGGDLVAPRLRSLPEGVIVGGDKKIARETRDRRDDRAGRGPTSTEIKAQMEDARARIEDANAKREEAQAEVERALAEANLSDETRDSIKDAVRESVRNTVNNAVRDRTIVIDTNDFDTDFNDSDSGLIWPEPLGMRAWLTVLVTLAACGALALGVAPQFLVRATERLAKDPLPSFGIGAASLIAVPALLIAVGITIIGIPFAILGAAAYVIGIGLGLIALCLWGGLMVRTLANQPGQETRMPKLVGWTLMGFLALAVIGAIPVVGRAIQIIAIITGAGAVLSTAWALRKANAGGSKAEQPA